MAQIAKNSKVGGIPILDFIYPVGAIFMTMDDDFNPSQYWGGTWKEINNAFIYGTTAKEDVSEGSTITDKSGLTGGEMNHVLTISEMPSHNHPGSTTNPMEYGHGWGNGEDLSSYSGAEATWKEPVIVAAQGGGQAHNNMPPYITAHIWQRTA